MLAPCLVQPGDALVQLFGVGDQFAGFRFEQRQLRLIRSAVRRQRAVQAHLIFRQLARKQRALVEQPGQHMHHPGGGLEPLGREREAHESVLPRQWLSHPGSEHRAHFVRQNKGFGVERFDNRARKIGGASHYAPQITRSGAALPVRYGYFPSNF